jgi:hypothetical protein
VTRVVTPRRTPRHCLSRCRRRKSDGSDAGDGGFPTYVYARAHTRALLPLWESASPPSPRHRDSTTGDAGDGGFPNFREGMGAVKSVNRAQGCAHLPAAPGDLCAPAQGRPMFLNASRSNARRPGLPAPTKSEVVLQVTCLTQLEKVAYEELWAAKGDIHRSAGGLARGCPNQLGPGGRDR